MSPLERTPVYFLSHGGPNIMYDHDHPAHRKLQEIGREITSKVKPLAVVVFSAHWQALRDTVEVNNAEITELIYDFYGFPSHYYEEKFPNVGSREIAQKVIDAIRGAGMKAEGVKRGLDHGVWASFKCGMSSIVNPLSSHGLGYCTEYYLGEKLSTKTMKILIHFFLAFNTDQNPLNVPIVQVSLFKTEDPIQHYRLGQAVAKLREENIQIIVSGMAVHNLRDLRLTYGDSKPMPYTTSFDEALKDAVTTPPAQREKALVDLLKRADARQAHPTFDHLLPIHVGAGAAGEDVGKRLWTLEEGSMSWAQFRFGEVGAD
ncbi:aromatic ring-opening dioxygenase LigB subunit [Blastomyces gilchristii SLH14081]|uniref:Aromatic ring-opening dioxygenase LigB subunit n=1 Tax=Blastomyces gilchristii (strain SLH14081) TaxID=559298 RepID=A0A179UNN5_BLAGS|nr:aromatic ring-opening dioxygenase LigB subunit [Blastomyces gilchristii SLH14081]OAT09594.1 aromatic ring-opening dioxygenase LigB subunit [Blastomyces gilchristii SLH14081]